MVMPVAELAGMLQETLLSHEFMHIVVAHALEPALVSKQCSGGTVWRLT